MNEIVSLSKEIEFNTMINKITSISLEHTLMKEEESNIKGDLIVSGSYKQTVASQVDNPFSYKIPVDIVLDDKYDLSDVSIDIDDFTYEVVDDNKLKVNVDLLLDNLIKKEVITNPPTDPCDELIKIDDLFLEDSKETKLEVPKEELETLELKEEQDSKDESLFSNLNSANESYKTYSIYIVRDNDTLEEIMNKYKVTREELEEYNNLNEFKIGYKLVIPSSNENSR